MKNKSGSSRTRTRLNGFSVRRIHHVCQRSIIILNTQLFYLRSIKAPQFEEVTPDLSLFCLCYADKTLHHRPTNSSYQQLSTCVRGAGRTRTCSPIKERIYSPRGYQLPVTSPNSDLKVSENLAQPPLCFKENNETRAIAELSFHHFVLRKQRKQEI